MEDYKPADLPEIDRVKILVIHRKTDQITFAPTFEPAYRWEFVIRAWVTLTGGNAQTIAALWRSLPGGEQDRCHNPHFGLRFYLLDNVILEASMCWSCNNVFLRTGEEWNGFNFNAKSSPAQELLAICKMLTAHD